MSSKHLSYFKVENFKRFDSLEVNDIGQFNLIVGDNNVGKTTLLEALLFDDEDYDKFLVGLEYALENREIYIEDYKINYLDFFIKDKPKPLIYTFQLSSGGEKNNLVLTKKNRSELTEKEASNIVVQLKLYGSPYLAEFVLNGNADLKMILTEKDREEIYYFPFMGSKIFYDEETFDFLTTISLSNKKLESLKKELKYFVPNLTSIEVSNSIVSGEPVIIIRESDSDNPKVLAEYGDGTIKLFRYLLKIDFSENKRLMIDEIDAGIHHSRMKEYLKKILQTAKNNNVQIFATTHSKECLEYYTQALQELNIQDHGRIIRIANTKIGIRAYTMGFEEFENAMIADSEIR